MKKKITRSTTLKDVLDYSGAEKILAKHNLPCLNCPLARFEMDELKLGDICKMYNINVEKLLKELNELLSRK